MMHGPFKFLLNSVMYYLFGVNDWSAADSGGGDHRGCHDRPGMDDARRWLGRTGAYLTAVMFQPSPGTPIPQPLHP